MAVTAILVCPCGLRLKATGAVPGRIGKCPSCGALLSVPGSGPADPAAVAPPSGNGPGRHRRPTTFAASPGRSPHGPSTSRESRIWDGLIRPPARPEARVRESLLYPLWGPSGIGLILFVIPLFWVSSLPWLGFLAEQGTGGNRLVRVATMIALLPSGMVLALVGSYALLFLGRVLVSSAIGEVHHPRWPEWELGEMLRGLGRWGWALVAGGVIGGFPAAAYWMYCGDVDLVDGIVLAELLAIGAVYGEVALLASLLHDDPLGANPVTVLRALWRVRWATIQPALLIGSSALLALWGLRGVLAIANGWVSAAVYGLYLVGVGYGAMVVLRVLGLFYHRHARVLGWFRDRPRWGV